MILSAKIKPEVYTSHYSYKGESRVDITVKTGIKIFAPTWDMVNKIKNKQITQEEYAKQYYELMRTSYGKNKNEWGRFLRNDRLVFVCFCPKDSFCHRYLLAEIFVKLGAMYNGEL